MMTSREMRELLTATGTPQGGRNVDQQIGPQINLRAAIERLRACSPTGEACLATKCCADASETCFRKGDHGAGCRATCIPGAEPDSHPDHLTHWSCDILGTSAPQHVLGSGSRYLAAETAGAVAGIRRGRGARREFRRAFRPAQWPFG